jgi:dienelactone hydrolase
MFRLALLFIILSIGLPAAAAVNGKEVRYRSGDLEMHGWLATDESRSGKRPGVLVVHEWWGHNEYARSRAAQLAEQGYTVLAVDMFGKGRKTDHPKEAGAFAAEVRKNFPEARKRFEAALDLLRKHPTVDPERIGAVGYCFGGGIVLEMARDGLDLAGVVSVHGTLSTERPASAKTLKTAILVQTGGADPMVPPDQIADFAREMAAAGADWTLVSYPGALHAFSNPAATELGKRHGIPVAYDAAADRQSWNELKAFLARVFGRD